MITHALPRDTCYFEEKDFIMLIDCKLFIFLQTLLLLNLSVTVFVLIPHVLSILDFDVKNLNIEQCQYPFGFVPK